MIVSINEQVSGHKVVVTETPPVGGGQRQAGCQCGWSSSQGSTEQVMPQVRIHLDAAVRSRPDRAVRPKRRRYR